MMKLLRSKTLIICVTLVISICAFNFTSAFSLDIHPIDFLHRTTDIILNRVSDIVYYLVMQKKYVFDDYTDPNNYIPSATNTNLVTPNNKVVINKTPITVKNETSVSPTLIISSGYFDDSEILKYTNIERKNASLDSFSPNPILNNIASQRVDDLFDNQYFDHVSPDGKTASAVAKDIGYSYILIGENLAMGNFVDDKEIVTSWMNSPGHRANILNAKYIELGVSKKDGIYKGEKTTIAVQIFGLPLGNCVAPSKEINNLIASSSAVIKIKQAEALILYNDLQKLKVNPSLDKAYYTQKIQEYNLYAKSINDSVNSLKVIIDYYNADVARYNSCVKP